MLLCGNIIYICNFTLEYQILVGQFDNMNEFHRYGEEAANATSEGLDAAGHAVGTAWAAFKIRQALNPKSVLKPTALGKSAAKAAAAEYKAKMSK
jgi:hypothetical protein